MKTVLFAFTALIGFFSSAQTAIIAHKSHAGTSASFVIDPLSNFGEYIRLQKLVQVIRLNDSSYVNVYLDEISNYVTHDTIHEQNNYNFAFDSLNETSHSNVEYLNFRKSSPDLKPVSPGYYRKESQQIPEPTPATSEPVKKKKKSYLLFLFGITGGGMLLIQLLRIFQSHRVIA